MEQKDIINKAVVEAMTDKELTSIVAMIKEEMKLRQKEDLSGPIGCLINMKREFEDEMDKIISEQSNELMEEMEMSVKNYNIAIDILNRR